MQKYILGEYTRYVFEIQWIENSRKYSFINHNIFVITKDIIEGSICFFDKQYSHTFSRKCKYYSERHLIQKSVNFSDSRSQKDAVYTLLKLYYTPLNPSTFISLASEECICMHFSKCCLPIWKLFYVIGFQTLQWITMYLAHMKS